MDKLKTLFRNNWFLFGTGLVLGGLIILALRFVTYAPVEPVHHHANFAVYINGQREQFKDLSYYEETTIMSCDPSAETVAKPDERAHMHSSVSDVVHVEDELVTWGHFFQNLRWNIGDDYIRTRDTYYANSETAKLSFILNGKPVKSIYNTVISSEDRLLISYDDESATELQKRFDTVATTAKKYNSTPDPAGCSGSKKVPNERWKHLF